MKRMMLILALLAIAGCTAASPEDQLLTMGAADARYPTKGEFREAAQASLEQDQAFDTTLDRVRGKVEGEDSILARHTRAIKEFETWRDANPEQSDEQPETEEDEADADEPPAQPHPPPRLAVPPKREAEENTVAGARRQLVDRLTGKVLTKEIRANEAIIFFGSLPYIVYDDVFEILEDLRTMEFDAVDSRGRTVIRVGLIEGNDTRVLLAIRRELQHLAYVPGQAFSTAYVACAETYCSKLAAGEDRRVAEAAAMARVRQFQPEYKLTQAQQGVPLRREIYGRRP